MNSQAKPARGARVGVMAAVLVAVLLASTGRSYVAAAGPSSPYSSLASASLHVSSSAAGASGVGYVVRFRTSSEGALVAGAGTIMLVAPPGTVLPTSGTLSPAGSPAPVEVGATVSDGGSVMAITVPIAVKAGTQLELSLQGVTNAPSPGPQRFQISTSSDLDPTTTAVDLQGVGHALGSVDNASAQASSSAGDASAANMTVAFSIPPGGTLAGGTGEIFLLGPPGTDFAGGAATLTDAASGLLNRSAAFTTLGERSGAIFVPATLKPGDRVVLTVHNVTNTGAAGTQILEVATSADQAWVDTSFPVVAPTSVADVSVSSSSSSAGATATNLTVTFRASGSGGLIADQGVISLLGPPGETFGTTGLVRDLTTGQSHSYWGALGGVSVLDGDSLLSVVTPIDIRPHDTVEVIASPASNPGSVGRQSVSVTTTSDTVPAVASFAATAPTSVSSPTVTVSATPSAGGGKTYTISFRTSATGSLVLGQGWIEVFGPPGTVFSTTGTISDETTHTSGGFSGYAGTSLGPEGRWLALRPGIAIGAKNEVVVTDAGVTPSPFAWSSGVTVLTTSDTRPAVAPFRAGGTTPPSGVAGASAHCSTTAAAATDVTCSFSFVASRSGALARGTGTVTVIGPQGFEMSGAATMTDLTTKASGGAYAVFHGSGQEIGSFVAPVAIRAGDRVSLSIRGVTLPVVPGHLELSLATSADISPAPLTIVTQPTSTVTLLSTAESSAAPGASDVTYTVDLAASPLGSLSLDAGTITLVAAAGTTLGTSLLVDDLTRHTQAGTGDSTPGDNGSAVSFVVPVAIGGGDRLQLVMTGVRNPPAAVGQLTVTTSSDDALESPAPVGRNRWISTIAASLRTPREAFSPAKSIPANASLAALVALFLSFPSSLFNQTFFDNYADIVAWWERRTRRLRDAKWLRALRARRQGRRGAATARSEREAERTKFVVVFVAGAVLASLNDPTFLHSLASLVTLPTVALSMLISITVPAVAALLYHRRRYHRAPWRWHSLPAGLAVGAACVLFSRLTGFEPGYLYGVMCSVLFTRKLGKEPTGHVAFLSTLAVLLVAVGAWFAWVPVAGAAAAHSNSVGLGFLEDFLAATFVGGLVGSFFSLIPVKGFAGFKIRLWNPRAWLALYFVVVLALMQVLLRPSTRANAPMSHAPLVGTIAAFLVAALGSVVFFEHFERKRRDAAAKTPSVQQRLHALVAAARRGSAAGPAGDEPGEEPGEKPESESAEEAAEAEPRRRRSRHGDGRGLPPGTVPDAPRPVTVGSLPPSGREGVSGDAPAS